MALGGLLAGFGFGFLVAAQVGPIWLLCARSVLRGRLGIGLGIGAGAAIIDLLYAALGEAGAAQVLRIAALREVLGLVGAAFLIYLGARSIHAAFRVRAGMETAQEIATPRAAFLTALSATASNPMTIASWGAIFTAAGAARVAASPVLLVLGVGIGSFAWFLVLSLGMSLLRRRVPERGLRLIDVLSGLGLLGFGALLGVRSLEGH